MLEWIRTNSERLGFSSSSGYERFALTENGREIGSIYKHGPLDVDGQWGIQYNYVYVPEEYGEQVHLKIATALGKEKAMEMLLKLHNAPEEIKQRWLWRPHKYRN